MTETPAPHRARPILVVEALRKTYPLHRSPGSDELVAVDDVSFAMSAGGATAIVGESGSGKTTCARIIVGLEAATSGSVQLDGQEIVGVRPTTARRRERARVAQLVFQDPYSSLDPRQRVLDVLVEVLRLHGTHHRGQVQARAVELLELVGLDAERSRAYPKTLSGGQRQRLAIARALAADPQILVLDEAVAALDVSIQAQILKLLQDVRTRRGVALLFITHDLAVAESVCDDVLVMHRGKVVEDGPIAQVLARPSHTYTRQMLDAVPRRGWKPVRRDRTATSLP